MRFHLLAILLAAGLSPATGHALDVNIVGLFSNAAVIVVDRGAPRTVRVGERTPEGVLLVSADHRGAVVEIDGKRQTLEMGQHYETPSPSTGRETVTLPADSKGHFVVDGLVNGGHVRFLVDTGATYITLPAREAQRLGIDYRKGRQGWTQTANGTVPVYRVMLDSVRVGDITLYNVEATIGALPGMDSALLGMSFLNRTELRREGSTLTLTKRY